MVVDQMDWAPLLKIYGPLGLGCALAIFLVARLLKYIQKQHEQHIAVTAALAEETRKAAQSLADDARKERDYSRQLREQEVNKFLESLRFRDEKMERGFDEIVRVLRESRGK
jgi:hypothetical protein